jgi:hypothetical protein
LKILDYFFLQRLGISLVASMRIDLIDRCEKIKFTSSGEHIISHDKIYENYVQDKSWKKLIQNNV